MDYKLLDDESFADGISRLVVEQLDVALENLEASASENDNKEEAIHDVRVAIKKVRALLRLVRDSLGKQIFNDEDDALRDTGRLLSQVRDSEAMLEILEKLSERFPDRLSGDAVAEMRTQLNALKRTQRQESREAVAQATNSLQKARERVATWPWADPGESFASGLGRIYKRGRRTFAAAYDEPSVETFHEWRKQVKHLLYQMRILIPVWPKVMEAEVSTLKHISKYLSEDHDLAVLKSWITSEVSETEEINELIKLIDQERSELQKTARPLGQKIYAEKPTSFARRIENYWEAWRNEIKQS